MVESSTRGKEYREVVVVPLAARREALILGALICLIILLMGVRFSSFRSVESKVNLRSYQLSDLNLKNQAPILYRSLVGSVGDIIDLREENGSWPDIDLLNSESLPPFASSFLPMGLRGFVWHSHAGEGWIDYFGVNGEVGEEKKEGKDPLENSFILRIIDLESAGHPHPHLGQHNEQAPRFSAQVWLNPHRVDYPVGTLMEKGWKWIVGAGTQSETVTFE